MNIITEEDGFEVVTAPEDFNAVRDALVEKGYEFDAVVLDDSSLRHPQELTVKERLERMIYLADDRNVVAKFVNGKSVPRDKDGDETAIFGGNQ